MDTYQHTNSHNRHRNRPTTGIDDFNLTWTGTGTTGITGTTSACVGSTSTLSDATTGGTWSSSSTAVATVGATTGIVTGVSAGTTNISYTVGGSTVVAPFTVNSVPSLTASVMGGTCGSTDTLVASGATTYTWSPTTGLSCASCATTGAIVSSTTAYSVTGTSSAGCSATATVSVDGNSIGGMITFSSTPPSSMGMKVWLIQFNSTDSSLIAQDSMATCLDGGVVPSYRFMDKPAGNYMVKAKLLSSVAGTTGYIPTYSLSTPHWDSAVSAVHGTGSDVLNINMLYGTVPTEPGFIGGLIVSGAGKHTSGDVPAPNVLVYLMDTSNHMLSYTYTDVAGVYSFSGLGYGSYIIYPVDYHYATTSSAILTITSSSPSVTGIGFKEHTTFHTITPAVVTLVKQYTDNSSIGIFPNPTTGTININWQDQAPGEANFLVTDFLGREVYNATFNMTTASGNSQIELASLKDGIYFVAVKSATAYYFNKLQIVK